MTSSASGRGDDSSNSLIRRLKKLRIGSWSPSSTGRLAKPLPRPPSSHAAGQSSQATPLPSYLAHLAEPSTLPRLPSCPAFPQPSVDGSSSSTPVVQLHAPSRPAAAEYRPGPSLSTSSNGDDPQPLTSRPPHLRPPRPYDAHPYSSSGKLNHAEPSTTQPSTHRPSAQQSSHSYSSGLKHAGSDGVTHVESTRLPPRPPAFIVLSESADSNRHDLPHSLQPGASSATPSYPWELVPQEKRRQQDSVLVQPRPKSATSSGKENIASEHVSPGPTRGPPRRRTSASVSPTPPSHAIGQRTSTWDVQTPPRRGPSASVDKTQATGSMTPSGSQTDVNFAPSKGQCWGIKQNNTRCTRKVRAVAGAQDQHRSPSRSARAASAPPALLHGASAADPVVIEDSEEGEVDVEEVYCHQHITGVNKLPGFYHSYPSGTSLDQRSSVFVKYSDWLGTTHLTDHAEGLLRRRMSQQLTDTDRRERGHIYVYELLALSNETHICLKVGRSIKVFRRLSEWTAQCKSKQPLLRALFPSEEGQGLIPGMDAPTMEGVYLSHQWEALIHLELDALGKRVKDTCVDCRRQHREIFMIPRRLESPSGSQREQLDGYDSAIQVILKWMRFVEMLASPTSSSTKPGPIRP
ncbi:hypothetical protein PSEUBRA_001947 [Kalmanozyma brasiliensis GHG001]|uniref:uncharacterized protein n=1 Tax=Kalmanozyma brasiliensis (strain GHG001) TaxID=1365824 RepID=UPI002868302B|nr:uncharacterized protein PSEUBRA_001947 [Kalmanozyma brasiliensis GHG001]KAF6767017.1 hypothetical protein PSEUBRA_001947 [Kalmanozyma brasiliensis GHG001]